jgi:hypothetical protein
MCVGEAKNASRPCSPDVDVSLFFPAGREFGVVGLFGHIFTDFKSAEYSCSLSGKNK